MVEQFFTDQFMLAAMLLAFAIMFFLGAVLFFWRDWDVIWIAAYLMIQAAIIWYYIARILNPDTIPPLVPIFFTTLRPAILSLEALIVSYSFVRFFQKRKFRH